jgi:diacylglycerol kinase family enzyme
VQNTYLLVANPTAQSGRNMERIARAEAFLRGRGAEVTLLPTLPAGGTIAAVGNRLAGGEPIAAVIAMGGDGTFREVASGLLDSGRAEEIALGMLPTGTANDQGRSFGLEARDDELERNLGVVLAGHETRLDGGKLRVLDGEGKQKATAHFFDSAGWGISARVLAARNRDRSTVEKLPGLRELYRDKLVYAGALLRTFLDSYVLSDKFDATVVADGITHELTGLTDLVIKATRIYAGAWVLDRTSRHDDGLFEIVPFRGKRDWTSKAIVDLEGNPLGEEVLNAVGIEHSRPFRGATIRIRFRAPEDGASFAAQLDGEEFVAGAGVEIDVLKNVLRLIIPGDDL